MVGSTDRVRILLVDDELAITESLSYSLETAGFEPIAVGDLNAASNVLVSHPDIALVILDLSLPDGHGFDWLKQLRLVSSIPVIILSSHDDEIEHIVGLEIGADDFIDKPFSPREVVARVRAILRRIQQYQIDFQDESPMQTKPVTALVPQSEDPTVNEVQEMILIDYLQYNVLVDGQSLGLSQLEFALFEALYFEQRVHTRAQLLRKAWGSGVSVSERTVDVHMTALRKKWAEYKEQDLIETVRGVGYKLSSNLPPVKVRGQPIK